MRKILAYFTGFTAVAAGTTSVVACNPNKQDQKKVDEIVKKINEKFEKESAITLTDKLVLKDGEEIPSALKEKISTAYGADDFKKLLGDAVIIAAETKDYDKGTTNQAIKLRVKLNKVTSKEDITKIQVTIPS